LALTNLEDFYFLCFQQKFRKSAGISKTACQARIRRNMSTKAAVARINGAKSQGPVTEQGKARSAQNSLKHGLSGSRVVLEHESQTDYDDLERSLINRFKPADTIERDLVQEMTANRWRLRRIEEMENAVVTKAIREQMEALGPDADPREARALAYAEVSDSKSLRTLSRYSSQLRRAYEKAWKELEIIQNERQREEREEDEYESQNEPTGPLTERMLHLMTAPPPPGEKSEALARALLTRTALNASPNSIQSALSEPRP
jgi:hypothetical protein